MSISETKKLGEPPPLRHPFPDPLHSLARPHAGLQAGPLLRRGVPGALVAAIMASAICRTVRPAPERPAARPGHALTTRGHAAPVWRWGDRGRHDCGHKG